MYENLSFEPDGYPDFDNENNEIHIYGDLKIGGKNLGYLHLNIPLEINLVTNIIKKWRDNSKKLNEAFK
jgi:hypothetical protein